MGKEVKPRDVAVAIPFCRNEAGGDVAGTQICLVSSRKHAKRYVLPKGGVEEGETGYEAAVREMWEEAGLRPTISRQASREAVASVLDHKPHKHSPSPNDFESGFVARARYQAFLVPVQQGSDASELDEWPEKDERERVWMTYEQACNSIEWRKDIHTLLLASKERLKDECMRIDDM